MATVGFKKQPTKVCRPTTKKDVRDLFADENTAIMKRKSQISQTDRNVKRQALNNLDGNASKYEIGVPKPKQPFKSNVITHGAENVAPADRPNTRSTSRSVISSYVDKFNSLSITSGATTKTIKSNISTSNVFVHNARKEVTERRVTRSSINVTNKPVIRKENLVADIKSKTIINNKRSITNKANIGSKLSIAGSKSKPEVNSKPSINNKLSTGGLRKPSGILKKQLTKNSDTKICNTEKLKSTSATNLENAIPKSNILQNNIPVCSTYKLDIAVNKNDSSGVQVLKRRSCTLNRNSVDKTEGSSLYMSACEEILDDTKCSGEALRKRLNIHPSPTKFDKELLHDPQQMALYAVDIFDYLKSRECKFMVENYMYRQVNINRNMRAMLVDWMVEVQENFELNHETLYLSVKLVDMYLSKVKINKEKLQLVGATALLLSSKYEERLSPMLEDFIHICDKAYTEDEILMMERHMLKAVNFELGAPLSYRFLRRYARCARVQMPLLTLARYILELSLLEYSAIFLSESKQAAAALYLAFKMTNHSSWTEDLELYTGYKLSDFKEVVILFNDMLHNSNVEQLTVIRNKYSHKIFFEVAKTPLLDTENLSLGTV